MRVGGSECLLGGVFNSPLGLIQGTRAPPGLIQETRAPPTDRPLTHIPMLKKKSSAKFKKGGTG